VLAYGSFTSPLFTMQDLRFSQQCS